MRHFAVSAVGRDRPGIVAGITGALLELDGNLEDSQMTILRGHFAVMLIAAVPDGVDRDALERRLSDVRDRFALEAMTVSDLAEADPDSGAPTHVITVYGADHPGIVHAVSSALAERGINITDLQTKLAGEAGSPLYVMMLEVELTDDADTLGDELAAVAERSRVEVSISELESEEF